MRIRFLLVCFCMLLAGCSGKSEPQENDDPLFFLLKRLDAAERAQDRIYHEARKLIMAAGWLPLQTNLEDDDRLKYGSTREFWKQGYREVEECGGDQTTFCNFIFKDSQGNKLFVTTSGKEYPGRGEFATVTFVQVISDYKPTNGQ